jgi:hypothetical protein
MKSFKQLLILQEYASYSTSELVFRNNGQGSGSSGLMIPISGPMFKRIWPDTIRTIVFHTTDLQGLPKLKRLEGGKKTISAFFSMMSRYMEGGIATGGGIVAEMEADVLISARDDIMSQVDNKGRRWVEMSWFANAQSYGTGPKFAVVERDLNDLIRELVLKHLSPILGKDRARREHEFQLWADMKKHMSGDGKALSKVIKDYFDGVEKIIKKNKEVMGGIFYGYAKSKRMTDNAWDEQIVNNIEIKKVHIIDFTKKAPSLRGQLDASKDFAKSKGWTIKMWDATETTDLEIYTRKVVAKEIKK